METAAERMVRREARWRRQSHFATIVGALVTAGSMAFGVVTYRRSAAEHRQAAAIGILQDYLKLAVEHPDLASPGPERHTDARYTWFATHALFTAETLWKLVGADLRWAPTIDSILRQHRGYLERGVLSCADFTQEFVSYMKSRIPELKCAPTRPS